MEQKVTTAASALPVTSTPVSTRRVAALALLACALGAGSAHADGPGPRQVTRVRSDRPFARVWVVERSMPGVYGTLARLTASSRFDAIVVAGGEGDGTRAAELDHLLAILPQGTSVWVGEGPVPVGLNVDLVTSPAAVPDPDAAARVVFCPDPELEPLAALAAMRLDATLTDSLPDAATELVVQMGGEPLEPGSVAAPDYRFVPDLAAALDLVNSLAGHRAVMAFRVGTLLPEVVLYSFQRDLLLVAVEPPTFSSYDAQSEIRATTATRDQIHAQLARLGFDLDTPPEALVVAGDWAQIPYRFARSLEDACPSCDNGVFEHSADAEYANLDGDPWGEPEMPVGRLMSYERDLLGLAAVLGVWKDHGAFPAASKGVLLDLLPAPWRDAAVGTWQDRLADRQWSRFGPEQLNQPFTLDQGAFSADADDADVVLVRAHGGPNFLGTLAALQLDGAVIAASAGSSRPAFWMVDACATARYLDPGRSHFLADRQGNNLLAGIQRRLALGAWLSVEKVGQGAASLWWPTMVAERGLTVGELARRATAAAVAAYRGDQGGPGIPAGLPQRGDAAHDLHNAWTPMFWVGDPLTVLE